MVGAIGGVTGGAGIAGGGAVGAVAAAGSAPPLAGGAVPVSPPATSSAPSSQVNISSAARQAYAAERQQDNAPPSMTETDAAGTPGNVSQHAADIRISIAINALNAHIEANGIGDSKIFNDLIAALLLAILLRNDRN